MHNKTFLQLLQHYLIVHVTLYLIIYNIGVFY